MREALNRLRWDEGVPLNEIRVYYRHRGAPDDTAVLEGRDIVGVGRSFLDLVDGGRLPHHRILRVEQAGRIVWERRPTVTRR